MPKYARTQRCIRDWMNLRPEERAQFRQALAAFLEDLPTRQFRPSLRVKGVQRVAGVFEMTWEYHDGRATFQFGDTSKGEPDIIWRRIGGHEIFEAP